MAISRVVGAGLGMAIVLFSGAGLASAEQGAGDPSAGVIEKLSWLAGCWEQKDAQRHVEEQWMAPRGGTMLGMGRTVVIYRRQADGSLLARIEGERDGRTSGIDFPMKRAACDRDKAR